MQRSGRILILAFGIALVPGHGTYAQVIGPSAAPTREQIEQRPPTETKQPPARLSVEGGIERAPCALDRPDYQSIRFTPSEVTFDDLKGLSAEDLRPAYAAYLGQEQPVSVICEIRDRAATILRDAGYVASVEVPEQRIADGRVHFQVLMAKMVAVRVRGDAGRAEQKIASYLNRLTEDEVFNRFRAERYLLLAGDLPGYSIRLALKSAGTVRGEVIGEVTVQHVPVMVDANVQNYGSQTLGRWGAMLRGQLFGLTGLGDRTTLSAYSTIDFDEQQTLQIGHDFRPGNSGLTIAGQFTYAWTHPDLGDDAINVKGRTLFTSLEASYPFIRRRSTNVQGAAGFELIDQDVDFNGLNLSRDKIRVAYFRLNADIQDAKFAGSYSMAAPHWRFGGAAELRQGLDIFGASPDCIEDLADCIAPGIVPPSRLEGNPTATVLRGTLYGEFRPMPKLTLAATARGQHSSSPLFSFEEFSAGNYTIGRGYDAGTILGDKGVAVQGELRFGSVVPRSARGIAAEPFVFVDQAWTWNEDTLGGPFPREELTSLGGGVRAAIGDQFRVEATLAVPMDRVGPDNKKPDPRFLLSFTSRILPWSFR